jgi:hypothetical protein
VRGGHGAARRQARRRRAGPARAAAEIDTGIIPLRGAVPFTTLRGTEDQKRALGEARAPSTACRLLARIGPPGMSAIRSLSGVKPTYAGHGRIDANDPLRTFDDRFCCDAQRRSYATVC